MRCAILINGVSSQSLLVLSGVLSYLFKKTHQHICGQGSLVRLIQNNAAVPAFKKIYTVKTRCDSMSHGTWEGSACYH
jgi:hypothetical protein